MLVRPNNAFGDPGQMSVMSEEQHLCRSCNLRQDLEPRLGATVIEIDEQVIGKKRQIYTSIDRLLQRG